MKNNITTIFRTKLRLGKNTIATFGEISPLLLNRFNIKTLVCGFEIYLDKEHNNTLIEIEEKEKVILEVLVFHNPKFYTLEV